LTKPLGRTQYIVGKFIGISIAGIVVTGLVGVGFCIVFVSAFDDFAVSMAQAHLLVMASVIPMCAVGVLFSVFLPDALAAILTALVIWFGHSTSIALRKIPVLYGGVVPDFNLFNLNAEATRGIVIQWSYLGVVALWGVSFSIFAVSVASLLFGRKDLK
jgi:ABC-type transport system involved in multi-copper enzyme maturation permease subunit